MTHAACKHPVNGWNLVDGTCGKCGAIVVCEECHGNGYTLGGSVQTGVVQRRCKTCSRAAESR